MDKIVPVVTREMLDAGFIAYRDSDKPAPYNQVADGIRAALAAAPESPPVEGLVGRLRAEAHDSLSGHVPIMLEAAEALDTWTCVTCGKVTAFVDRDSYLSESHSCHEFTRERIADLEQRLAAALSAIPAREEIDDSSLMNAIVNLCDTLDITRVSEMRNGEWHATTIFDGDAALLRTVRALLSAKG